MPRYSVSPQPKASEADAVGYLAKVLADWDNTLDPLSVQAALDQLAAKRAEIHVTLFAGAEASF